MSSFVDTSGLYAVVDGDDACHRKAAAAWRDMLERDESLVTTNYVLLETTALVQHRLGLEAVRVFVQEIVPVLTVVWVGEEEHGAAMGAVLSARARDLSLVDCTSFFVMRRIHISRCFAFDAHFRAQGFDVVP